MTKKPAPPKISHLFETTYVNGGVTNGLRKLFVRGGWVPDPEEALTMAAHAAMPAGVEYTESELQSKREELRAMNQ